MKILTMETSTALGSVAVSIDGQIQAEAQSPNPRSHSEFLNRGVSECLSQAGLKLQDIDFFGASRGPGSFTGIRVAGNAAKSFCSVFGKKMLAPDSLWLLHQGAVRTLQNSNLKTVCILNAYKNLLYTAVFDGTKVLKEPCVLSIPDVEQLVLEQTLVVGDGFQAYENRWSEDFLKNARRDSKISDHPLAKTLALEADSLVKSGQTIEWNLYLPLYLRASEAEENLRVK